MRFDGSEAEMCERCGFDSGWWSRRDTSAVLGALGYWWRHATAGISEDDLNRRPAPGVWSTLEYGLHSAMVLPILRHGIQQILAGDGVDVHDPYPGLDVEDASRPLVLDRESIIDDLEREGAGLGRLAMEAERGWEHLGRMDDGSCWQAGATLLHAVHDTTHHFLDVGEGLARIGAAVPSTGAKIDSVKVSDGGVPKLAVQSASVRGDGLDGDRQADRKHHGRPFQAVCLWSAEAIAQLADQGHSMRAGTAGENLTLSGVDWAGLRPGTRVLAGTALLELSYPAIPCQKQARWFSDGDISRLSHADHPEWARWYAWVRRPGHVRPGDTAVISPV